MGTTSGTARRLLLAFGSIFLVFSAGSVFTLAAHRDLAEGLRTTRGKAESVRLALELASAVRDQYAHQAHTIIIGDESHLGFYGAAQKRVAELLEQVRARAASPEEQGWVQDIAGATLQLDRVFRERIVPAVVRGERAEVKAEHDRAQVLVNLIQERVDRLVGQAQDDIRRVEERLDARERASLRWMIAFHAAAALLALGMGLWIWRSVARPVARLRAGAERLAAGDLGTRIEVGSDDELGALAGQFNAMTGALREHQARLVQSEKLAGIGRLAAGVAHEINNPLAVILGYATLLRRRSEGKLAEELHKIEVEAGRAQEIVEGLLDLSRPLASSPEPVALGPLCRETVARLAQVGRLDGIEVRVEGEAAVVGHPQKLGQVLLNLVRNAAEAAGHGGKVVLGLQQEPDGSAQVTVTDTGPGLSPAALERLFEPFHTTKPSGTGLGLAVSLGIVQAHGGSLGGETLSGGGARFTIRLPTSPPGRA